MHISERNSTEESPIKIYISVFLSRIKVGEAPTLREDEAWPYDYGDDPSFRTAKALRGPLTWGVCRPNVRNRIRKGDIVVFISCSRQKNGTDSAYRFCAISTVSRKAKQTEIYRSANLRQFMEYPNLLVRPTPLTNGWEHYEPPHKGPHGHSDWLSRIAERVDHKKSDFEQVERTDKFDSRTVVGGRLVRIARNYVIFSTLSSETFVLPSPPLVASYTSGRHHESWRGDKLSKSVENRTLGEAKHARNEFRWLRNGTPGHPFPHSPISFEMAAEDARRWRAELIELASGL